VLEDIVEIWEKNNNNNNNNIIIGQRNTNRTTKQSSVEPQSSGCVLDGQGIHNNGWPEGSHRCTCSYTLARVADLHSKRTCVRVGA